MNFRALGLMVVAVGLCSCGGPSGDDAGTGGSSGSTGGGSATVGGGSGSTGGGSAVTGGGSGSTGGGSALQPNGGTCGSGAACESGFCVDGQCCNSACTGACESCSGAVTGVANGTCAPKPNGGVCRAAAGLCDVAEVCMNGQCGADGFADAGVLCRGSAGSCDVAEVCAGDSAACPADMFIDAGTVCRTATGVCDVAETCSGAAAACPSDSLTDAGVVCRTASGDCDQPEVCTGTLDSCPLDTKKASGTVCGPARGPCDIAETCNGTDNACPTDVLQPPSSLACAPFRCNGVSTACTTQCFGNNDCASDARSVCTPSGACVTARLAFVTSAQVSPNFGGVAGGNAICNALAVDAGLGTNFKAWLSDPTTSPSQTFNRDGGVWIRMTDKARVAADWAALTVSPNMAIGYTEKGLTTPMGQRSVFTGTNIVGNLATVSGGQTNTHCSNWSSISVNFNAIVGQCDSVGANWTASGGWPCNAGMGARLYCFEQ